MKKQYWVSVILVIIVVGLAVWFLHKKGPQQEPSQSIDMENSGNPAGTASTTPTPTPTKSGSTNNKAYNDALAIYGKNGYRIQFSQCHGIPGKLVVPQGNKYMLDNRDNAAHTIKVGPNSYRLGAYGFTIVTALNLGINNVTCDGGGAAQVTIEK